MNPFVVILVSSLVLLLAAALRPALAATEDAEIVRESTAVDPGESVRVRIADPFIELHTGPASGYPIYHVVDRGEEVEILRRRTDWFKLRTADGKEGWASRAQMQQTPLPGGGQFRLSDRTEADFPQRQWVLGVTGGEFESAPVFTFFGAYAFTPNLSGEVHFGQSVGDVSSATFWKANLVMQPMPEVKYSPYLTLGLGRIEVSPGATLIVAGDETNTFAQFGVGFQRYISRSFMLRFEANEYVIFSASNTSDDNEEVNEWKFGFAVFF